MYNSPLEIFTIYELDKITKTNVINSDIIIKGNEIKSLGKIKRINGTLGLNDSIIENLGCLKFVKYNFFITSHATYSNLKSLDNLEFVGNDLILRYSNIEDLGSLKKVGGNLSLRDTKIKNLCSLEFVGGNLFLPKSIEKDLDLSKVTVKGKIKFWNDSNTIENIFSKNELDFYDFQKQVPSWNNKYIYSYSDILDANPEQINFFNDFKILFLEGKYIDLKGNDNYSFILLYSLLSNHGLTTNELQNQLKALAKYYPNTSRYTDSALIKKFETLGDFENAWKIISQDNNLNVKIIIEYEKKLNRELLDAELIIKLAGFRHLTEFGQKNINNIIPFAEERLKRYKLEKGIRFFELFLQNGLPININKMDVIDNNESLDGLKSQDSGTFYEYSPNYYKDFFLSMAEYEHYKTIDKNQLKSGYQNPLPHVIEKSIFNQCRLILKQSEDLYREAIGMPKVGEGWISETELFYLLSNYFVRDEVIHHASPNWLGRQHLDIYFPKHNIAIEYQGQQHYEPIDFFGGHDAYLKSVERDQRKQQLCKENNCTLIYVMKGYNICELISTIEEIRKKERFIETKKH